MKRNLFIRNIEAGSYLEYFLVSAIAAILLIRLFLALTGYPQIGGQKLHLAHLLWGGLLMLFSIFMLLSFLGRTTERWAAFVGGVGFGTFIDEVGKFITQDNDYFYQPAVAVIYVTFVLLILLTRSIHTGKIYSSLEYRMNALRQLEEVILHDLDSEEKKRALYYLKKSDSSDYSTHALQDLLKKAEITTTPRQGAYFRIRNFLQGIYHTMVSWPLFSRMIILFFSIQFAVKFIYVLILVFLWGIRAEQVFSIDISSRVDQKISNLSFIDLAEISSSLLSGVFIFLGIWNLRKSRLLSYRMFERSILISILLTQVFIFYKEQFGALIGLFFNILVYITLRYMINQETRGNLREQFSINH